MAAAVIELDTLPDSVGPAAENHNFLAVVGSGDFVLLAVVGRIVIGLILHAGNGNLMPRLDAAEPLALRADILFGNAEQLREILVGKAVLFRLDKHFIGQKTALVHKDSLLFLHQLTHLIDEIALHAGTLENLFVGRTLAESLVHLEVTLGVRY